MPWITIGPYDEYEAFVDDEDAERVQAFGRWYLDGRYVKHRKNGKRDGDYRAPAKITYLHRFVLGLHDKATEDDHVHHLDGNTLNNSKANIKCVGRLINNRYAVRYRDTGCRDMDDDNESAGEQM